MNYFRLMYKFVSCLILPIYLLYKSLTYFSNNLSNNLFCSAISFLSFCSNTICSNFNNCFEISSFKSSIIFTSYLICTFSYFLYYIIIQFQSQHLYLSKFFVHIFTICYNSLLGTMILFYNTA